MRHYLKRSIEFLIPIILLLSLSPDSNSIIAVHGLVETLPETPPDSNVNDDITPELNTNQQTVESHEPPQPQEQRGGWGTSVSYHHQPHASGERNSSSTDSAVKQENNGDKKISDFEGHHVPFMPIKNKQINKMPTDGNKNKPQDAVEQPIESGNVKGPKTIDISMGGGESKDNKIISHVPPEGFSLTAHIVTNPQDGQSYFTTTADDPQGPTDELLIPFLECGAVGSTTQGIPLHRAFFRHFPKLAHPTEFTPAREPHLLICLNQLEMAVSGGSDGEEKRVFDRGSVILVEDMMGGGHKLYSTDSDVSVLMLTLPPSTYHHHGAGKKEEIGGSVTGIGRRVGGGVMSLLFGRKKQIKNSKLDCQLEHDPAYSALGLRSQSDVDDDDLSFVHSIARNAPRKRRVILTSIGLGLSTIVSIFLSKVAPLQLAVGIGGMCVVGGGTVGIVKGGEWLCDEAEVWVEREQRYRLEEIPTEDEQEESAMREEVKVEDIIH